MTGALAPVQRPPSALDEAAVADLRKTFDGEIVLPAHAAYEDARRVWNAMIDKLPSGVVRPRGTADVAAAVRFARTAGARRSQRVRAGPSTGRSCGRHR